MPETLLSYQPLWMQLGRGRKFVQLAGVFGALAVAAAAYGAHGRDLHGQRDAWATAVQIHFIHTLALLAAPLFRHSNLVGYLLIIGQLLFCLPIYIHGLTGEATFSRLPPAGGVTLIFAWLAMAA